MLVELGQFLRALGAHVELHEHLVGDGVDRGAAAGDAGRIGGLRRLGRFDGVEVDHRLRHGGHGIDQAEGAVGVAAGTLEGDLVTPGPHALVHHPVGVGAVHGEEGGDLALVPALGEQVARAAQVARALLAHIAHEQDVGLGLDLGGVQGAHIGQQGGEAAGVVADAGRHEPVALAMDLHVGAFGEHRVLVGGQDHEGALALGLRARTDPCDIALGVHLHIGEALGLEHVQIGEAAGVLLEGRGGDLGELDDVGDGALMVIGQLLGGGLEGLGGHQLLHGLGFGGGLARSLGGRRRRLRAGGEDERQGGGGAGEGAHG